MLQSCQRSLLLAIALTALAGMTSLSCAEERKPINKVQTDAMAKKFFVGDVGNPDDDPEFYWRNFVVDASEAQELIGIGSASGVDRIKWEITEKTLLARKAYGQNPAADDKGTGPGFPDGTIVAAYPIDSHFDVRRAYNPQTGEELNVVEENTTDRPWYQRDYFRVDWSLNQVDTPQWDDMFTGKLTGEVRLTPVAYYVSDRGHDDAPHFDAQAGYFDVTSKFSVEPKDSYEFPGYPQCAFLGFLTGTAIVSCDPQEATVRSSYWRVDHSDPNGDFEPFENLRAALDIVGNPGGLGDAWSVGNVTPPRVAWDPGYGYVDAGATRLMGIHDVWRQSHQTRGECKADADCRGVVKHSGSVCLPSGTCSLPCNYAARGDTNLNGTDDQCENGDTGYRGNQGAQCSLRNRCTIPYRDREVKPIAYWVNPDMPDELQDELDGKGNVVRPGPSEDVIFTWNQAIGLAVAHAREVECRRTGGARGPCHEQFFETGPGSSEMVRFGGWGIPRVKDREDTVVVCHNPVRDYDSEACGERGAMVRVGDIRHSLLFYWPWSSRAPWGGIGMWKSDPLTGQIIGASATVLGRSATRGAATLRDVLLVANGSLELDDITSGVPASRFQLRLRTGDTPKAIPTDEVKRRMATIDIPGAVAAYDLGIDGATAAERAAQALGVKLRTTADPALMASTLTEFDGIAAPLHGSLYEAQLTDPAWLVDAAGLSPSTPLDEGTLTRVSPLRGHDPVRMGLANRALLARMNARGVCLFAAGDGVGNPDIGSLARYFWDPNDAGRGIYRDSEVARLTPGLDATNAASVTDARARLIYDHVWKETYKGIALHEVGHSLGLLHNFTSSWDAPNYDPQYWQLRTNEGAATASCNGLPRPEGDDSCMGPRFDDPETPDELGRADEPRPGINYFSHTSTMEYSNERFFETIGLGQYDVMAMGALYGRVLETFDPDAADGVPQGDQQKFMWLSLTQLIEDDLVDGTTSHYTELARDIGAFAATRCRAASDEEKETAEWRIVHGQVCSPPPKDHAAWGDFIDRDVGAGNLVVKAMASPDAPNGTGNVRWPYRWGVTNNAYLHTNGFDVGADAYEVTREAIRKFDYSYPFTYFRRQRRDWDYEALPSSTADQFFERLRSYHWNLGRGNAILGSLDSTAPVTGSDVTRANLLAEYDMFRALARAIVMPQVGAFSAGRSLGGRPLYDAVGGRTGDFSLDASQARFVDPTYNGDPQGGGSWDYINWVERAGFYVEKQDAIRALTDGRPTLSTIQRETYLDGRHLYVSFRSDLSQAVDRLIGGVLASDWESIASYVTDVTDPVAETFDLAAATPTRPTSAFLLFPNLGYKQQLGGVIYAQIFSRLGTDLGLVNKLLVYVEGSEGVVAIPDADQIKFTDPRSGITYVAKRFGPDTIDGKVVDRGIASRMLAHANDLLARAYTVTTDAAGAPVLDAHGQPTLVLDAAGQPIRTAGSVTAFADYVGLLDSAAEVARILGHGVL